MATYKVTVEGKEFEVTVVESGAGTTQVSVEGQTFNLAPGGQKAAKPAPAPVAAAPAAARPAAPPPPPPAPSPAPARAAAKPSGSAGSVHAPIPGVVTKILVAVGDRVEAGQVVLKLEAMKMENDIAAPAPGTVKEVAVAEGAEVSDGQLLVAIA
jgi:biotin carboxyl carrier protein